ncbi:MAG: hypothetical protein ACOYU2_01590 [Nitrospirota bacterium]
MERVRKVLVLLLIFTFLFPLTSFAGRLSETERLEKLINMINKNQSKNLKTFEKKAKDYFSGVQKPDVIETLIKEFPPGDTVTIIIMSNLSKKPYRDIANMRKSGKRWEDIASQLGIKLKDVIKDVISFRSGIG